MSALMCDLGRLLFLVDVLVLVSLLIRLGNVRLGLVLTEFLVDGEMLAIALKIFVV